ncbi:MAG: serine/threonine protein kinase, partial [Planctomycetia bacterium]
LRQRLTEIKRVGNGIPADEMLTYLTQAAEGLDFLNVPQHEFQGKRVAIYHRDLRPENLLIFQENGQKVCRVSDFGLAKPVTDQVAQHSQGLIHYDYDPPEFFEGQTSPTSDQYALAINYYELRTGELPFRGTMLDQLQMRLSDNPNLSLLNEPERSALRKALSRKPENRYPSCLAFAQAVGEALKGMDDTAPPPAQSPTPRGAAPAAPVRTNIPRPTVSPSAPRPFPTAGGPSPAPQQPRGDVRFGDSGSSPGLGAGTGGSGFGGNPGYGASVGGSRDPLRPTGMGQGVAVSDIGLGQRTPDPASLKNIRDQLSTSPSSSGSSMNDSGETRIPLVWVVLILALTAVGAVGATMYFVQNQNQNQQSQTGKAQPAEAKTASDADQDR